AGCISGFDKERGCDIIDTKRLAKAVSGLKNVILDSHYSHEMPCDAVVVLKTSPGVLRGRLRKKGWPDRKVEENVQAEIMEVCKAEALELGRKTFEVDTTLKKPEEAAEEVLKILKRFLNI
ncbi:MAG: AAA family ATPase, partial [Candidatus Aenigmatarchaeota archaeon]